MAQSNEFTCATLNQQQYEPNAPQSIHPMYISLRACNYITMPTWHIPYSDKILLDEEIVLFALLLRRVAT